MAHTRESELRFYIPIDTKSFILETFFPANLLAGTEKPQKRMFGDKLKQDFTDQKPQKANLTVSSH